MVWVDIINSSGGGSLINYVLESFAVCTRCISMLTDCSMGKGKGDRIDNGFIVVLGEATRFI